MKKIFVIINIVDGTYYHGENIDRELSHKHNHGKYNRFEHEYFAAMKFESYEKAEEVINILSGGIYKIDKLFIKE